MATMCQVPWSFSRSVLGVVAGFFACLEAVFCGTACGFAAGARQRNRVAAARKSPVMTSSDIAIFSFLRNMARNTPSVKFRAFVETMPATAAGLAA